MPVISRSEATRNLGRGRKNYYVYLLTNRSGTLYTGLTSDLERRVYEHKHKLVDGFTKKYNIDMLVYYEETDDVEAALWREKQIKAWRRSKRVALIESMNPQWRDLSEGWFAPHRQIPRFARNDSWGCPCRPSG
jgi:putative endonuclease